MRKKKSKIPITTFIILILLSITSLAIINLIETSEYVEANVLRVDGTVITIGNNCTAIVAETSPERAYSIELGIKGVIEQRPNTHDIFAQTLKSFNITLDHVTIDNFENGIYYANLHLISENKVLKLDSKPSDSIALALRTNSTIYINRTMLQEIGKNIC
jgi:bifunctional DNase/RNase